MTLKDTITLFLDSRKRGVTGARKKCSPATLKIYADNLKVFSDFMVEQGVVHYQEITRMQTVQFFDSLDEKQQKNEWSKATCLQILRSLKAFFRWVDLDEDMQEEGLKGMQKWLPVIEKTPRRTDIPQSTDIKAYREALNTSNIWDYRDYVASALLSDTGLRIGELCNLRVDHVLFNDQVLIVSGKTGVRQVAITKDMLKLLKGWMKRRVTCRTAQESPFVFVSKYRPQMDPNGFGQRFRKHCKKNSLPKISPHRVRHAFCTNYLRNGGDMEKLRLMTGHTTYTQLQGYIHLAKLGGKAQQEELEKVSLLKDV